MPFDEQTYYDQAEVEYTPEKGGQALGEAYDGITYVFSAALHQRADLEFIGELDTLLKAADRFVNGGDRSEGSAKAAREIVMLHGAVLYGQAISERDEVQKENLQRRFVDNNLAARYIDEETKSL